MAESPTRGNDAAPVQLPRDRWRLALEAGGIGVWAWEAAGDTVSWSPKAVEIVSQGWGTPPATLEAFLHRVHPEDRAMVRSCFEDAAHRHVPQHLEFRTGAADGSTRWLRWSAVGEVGGAAQTVVGIVLDITERKEIEVARDQLLREERRARAEAESARARLHFLISAGGEIRAVLDPDAVRRSAVAIVSRQLGEWALVLDPAGVVVDAGAGVGFPPTETARTLHLAPVHEAVARAVASGTPQLAGGPVSLADIDAPDVVHTLDAASVVAVPLLLGARRVGVLVAGHRRTGRPYQPDELDVFSQFADSLAATLVKASLFAERSAVARALQHSLLPPTLPDIPGLEVAAKYVPVGEDLIVGGDFYDLFRVSEHRYAFAIGDVSGKGAEAAAMTALVRHSVRAYAELLEDPSEVLAAVNEAVRIQGPSPRYCTLALGFVSIGEQVDVAVALGGHPVPIVARADGAVEPFGVPGTLLGIFGRVTTSTSRTRLEPGDTIVLYTDGVTEARTAGAPFGEERLHALVKQLSAEAPATLAAAIGAAVAEYWDHQADDVAVLVIRRATGDPGPGPEALSRR